jgi:hypothetical protein
MRGEEGRSEPGFPEDGFDLEGFKREVLAKKRARGQRKPYAQDREPPVTETQTSSQDGFDLDKYKLRVLAQKKIIFWRRNSRLFSLFSTVSMLALFAAAYFIYTFLADILANQLFMR